MQTEKDQIRYLLDRLEIQDVIARYAVGQDDHQADRDVRTQWDTVFTPDAVLDYTAGGFREGTYVEVAEWMRGRAAGPDGPEQSGRMDVFTAWQHMLGLPVVEVNGDTATARTDLLATHRGRPGPNGGWYFNDACTFHDRLARTTNGWRITHRRLVLHWANAFPTIDDPSGSDDLN